LNELSTSSRLVADDLRRAERSISIAARDAAQFLATALDVVETHGLSPAYAQPTIKATVNALAALAEGQEQLAVRAHRSVERAGTALGLTVTNWGEGAPKPAVQPDDMPSTVTAEA
jgi:hypothetical protein